MPGRAHDDIASEAAAIREQDGDPGPGLADPDAFALNDAQLPRTVEQDRLDQACNVVAVNPARNEAERIGAAGRAASRAPGARGRATQEMIGSSGNALILAARTLRRCAGLVVR